MMMLARTWTTSIVLSRATEYEAFARDVSLPMFRSAPGCTAVLMTRREDQCQVLTVWQSNQDIDAFERSHQHQATVERIREAGFLTGEQMTTLDPLHVAWPAEA